MVHRYVNGLGKPFHKALWHTNALKSTIGPRNSGSRKRSPKKFDVITPVGNLSKLTSFTNWVISNLFKFSITLSVRYPHPKRSPRTLKLLTESDMENAHQESPILIAVNNN